MLKFYKSMTLLNTMDRILYESQRQVRGDRLGQGGVELPEVALPVCLGQKVTPKEERVERRSFVLGSLKFLWFSWSSGGRVGEGCCPGQKDGPDPKNASCAPGW